MNFGGLRAKGRFDGGVPAGGSSSCNDFLNPWTQRFGDGHENFIYRDRH